MGWEDMESNDELNELAKSELEWWLNGGLEGWTLTQWGEVVCPDRNWGWRPQIQCGKSLGGTIMSRQ